MSGNEEPTSGRRAAETVLTHGGRHPQRHFGFVNTPVYRGSTVLFGTLDELESTEPRFDYGRTGNPSSSAYGPTRRFSNGVLSRMGITTEYYDPRLGGGIEALITDRTKAIFVESPGSLTFEVQDLRAIVEAARRHDAFVIVDNSWATPLYHKPLELGADIVVHAGTKMFLGHSDAMFGTASANDRAWPALHQAHMMMGLCAAPDDCFLAARGLRTLAIRMREQSARAIDLAQWLQAQDGVDQVFHPALESHADHQLFKRDFTGSGSVFSMLLRPARREAVAAMVDDLELFGMGWSWGGYESLLLPIHPEKVRTATAWQADGNMFRIHVGLEDLEDLRGDLAAAVQRYRAAVG
jgi:cystathionine beta-lyase